MDADDSALRVSIDTKEGRLSLHARPGDSLARVWEVLGEAAGERRITLGPLLLQGSEDIHGVVEEFTMATGRASSDATFCCLDFEDLVPHPEPCWIPDTALRGISLLQLHRVLRFVGHKADVWHEAFPASPDYGRRLPEEQFNLYHASYWIISPATQGCGEFGCSFVERIAQDPESQRPSWFVSHAWLEPICLFVSNLSCHAHVRQLEPSTPFWVCAYANNQHHLEADLGVNPRRSSFYRAMQRCQGVVLLLDDQATPFLRIWCCFEEAIAVEKRDGNDRSHRLLLDVCATDADGVAHVITDGLAGAERTMVPLLGLHHKTCREMTFPVHILQQGLQINILSATASHDIDRTRILNSIAFPGATLEELTAEPPEEHHKYQHVNNALSAQFALASWCNCILHGWDALPLAKALFADTSRRQVQLSFTGNTRFCDQDLAVLVEHLPENLEVLRLDLGFTGLETLSALGLLGSRRCLVHLELRLPGIKHLRSIEGLGAALEALPQLRQLELWFSKLPLLEAVDGLAQALGSNLPALEELVLNLNLCPKVPLSARQALFDAVKRLRKMRRVMESWVYIQDVDEAPRPLRFLRRWLRRREAQPEAQPAPERPPERPERPERAERAERARPVLLGRAHSVYVDPKSPDAVASPHSLQWRQETVPFPCSQPGCHEFHDDAGGYCRLHRCFRIPWTIAGSLWVLVQQLGLGFMVFTLASLELESKAQSTLFLASLSPILCQSLAVNIGGTVMLWMCLLVPFLVCGIFGTSARFNSMYRIATKHELTLEALCSELLQVVSVLHHSAHVSTVFGCEDTDLQETLIQEVVTDLRSSFLQARHSAHAFQREVCWPINQALYGSPGQDLRKRVQPQLRTLHSAKEALGRLAVPEPRRLVDVLYCDVICADFQEVRAVVQALQGQAQGEEASLQVVHRRDGFSRDFQDAEGRCGQLVVKVNGYLATVRVYEASLHELQEQMGKFDRLVQGVGLFSQVSEMDRDTPLRPIVEKSPPWWFCLLRVCTSLVRLLALGTAAYFALQYFVRYGPEEFQNMPSWLATLLAWSDDHDQDVVALQGALDPSLSRTSPSAKLPALKDHTFFAALTEGLVYSFPYVVHVVIFLTDLVRGPSYAKLTTAPVKRLKPMHLLYRYFGVEGSLYTVKVALLQIFTVLLQSLGKMSLLSSIATAGLYAEALSLSEQGEGAVADVLITGFWSFILLLGVNSIYPAVLVLFDEKHWCRLCAAGLDASIHLGYILVYLSMSLVSLRKLSFKDTLVGNFGSSQQVRFTNELNPIFPFPTSFVNYLSIYISLVHVCCVCRALEEAAAKFAVCPEQPEFGPKSRRSLSSMSLVTRAGVRRPRLLALGYAVSLLSVVGVTLAMQQFYPNQSMDLRCYPCTCKTTRGGLHRLENCNLAASLRFKYLNLASLHIREVAPDVFHPLGGDLMILSLAQNQLHELAPALFSGLSHLQLLDLSRNHLSDLGAPNFHGLERLNTLSLSQNDLRQLHVDVFQPMPGLQQILLGGTKLKNQEEEIMIVGNPLMDLPPGIFRNLHLLNRLDVSENRLSKLRDGVFASLPSLAVVDLSENLLEELGTQAFKDLPGLRQLLLKHNFLKDLGAWDLPGLEELDYSKNKLSGAFGPLSGVPNLLKLNISENELTDVQGAFTHVPQLQTLDISGNNLMNLTPSSFNLSDLQALWAANLPLPQLLPLRLPSLQRLELQGGNLQNISPGLFDAMADLLVLNLDDNELSSLDLGNLPPKLQNLSLSRNLLDSLEFNGCQEDLVELDLSHNRLSNWTALCAPLLQGLDLSGNALGLAGPFGSLGALRVLHLDSAQLELAPSSFQNLSGLEELTLSGNHLASLPEEVFKPLEGLNTLDISQNKLELLPPTIFDALDGLTTLNLSSNQLQNLTPGTFQNLSSLRVLDISQNMLPALQPGVWSGLERLESLSARGLGLRSIFEVAELGMLGGLDLSENALTQVPSGSLMRLEHLRWLNLSGNPICELEPGSFQGPELQVLDLSGLCLKNFSVNVSQALTQLVLARNGLQSFGPLEAQNLSSLDLSSNALEAQGVWVEQLGALVRLSLRGNALAKVPRLPWNLQDLDLAENQLSGLDLPGQSSEDLLLLRTLDASWNQLQRMDLQLPFLTGLHLDGNLLESLAGLCSSPLQVLSLRQNKLASLPPEVFSCLFDLRVLNLGSNQLSDIKPLQSLRGLHSLNLQRNHLTAPSLGRHWGLQTLDLSHNPLGSLELPKDLLHLSLRNVSLSFQPLLFRALTRLRSLDLSWNPLRSVTLGLFQGLQGLVRLRLQSCQLHTASFQLGRMEEIDLSNNLLEALPVLKGLSLRKLLLSGNRLEVLPQGAFSDLQSLEVLSLRQNRIKEIQAGAFDGLWRMELLDLSHNQLRAAAPELFTDLQNLKILNLLQNDVIVRDFGCLACRCASRGCFCIRRSAVPVQVLTDLDEDELPDAFD
ncbi:unnamed protein product [Effrenium voratum]|uniref:Chaoptin n=1 Tax=Effrenium voratum TaxID=2562239 RepID=A0AA36JEK6_9DINO|nr:unnamed protein product [Effrenium voratum]